ncbi:MFS transporter [Nocardia yamanashiensis]|uniref:MFS transporter n=1 Tax=Nocardia yamanashiensis TaxID=209247 RepID=UPI001E5CE1FC|nr:MFS transporter [Nocardia yamanashiensis]UGT41780.1 MFS transporter [Nocardia yamanashiensis]
MSVRVSSGSGRWVLLATVLGSGMAMLDATVVNVALPRIAEDFGASMAGLQWTVNAYTLTLAGFILLGGSLGDRYGRRRIFMIGVVWFAIASALCGVAQDISMLIAARALQGIGGALLTPGSLAIIQASFAPEDRAKAVGAWSGLGGVAGAIGPFLGGWLVDAAGWRWVFLLNLPLAAVVLAVTARHVPETFDEESHGRFDVLGAVLAALSLAGITYALTEAPEKGANLPLVIAAAALGVACAVAFVVLERRRTAPDADPPAMLPVDVFASKQFSSINAVTFVMYGAMSVVFFLLVLTLQLVSGFSPIAAGTALLPVTVLMLLFSARAGALAQRIGPRRPITIGVLLAAGGMLLMTRVGAHTSYLRDVLPAALVFGAGLALAVAPLTATVLASAPERHAGVASGVNNAVARAAGLLAVAAVPPLAGLTGDAYNDPARFGDGFRTALLFCVVLMVAAAALAFLTVRDDALRTAPAAAEPQCKINCAVGAPPLEPAASQSNRPSTGSEQS